MTNKPSDYTWALEDSLVPEHKHGELDDRKNMLRDTETGEYVSIGEANEIAEKRLGGFFNCEMDRRGLFKTSGAVSAGVMLATSAEPRYAFAADSYSGTILVNIFLRGGADGLSIITPYNDSYYQQVRNKTKVNLAQASIINATYALSPDMKPLLDAWNAGELAFANAVGTKGQTRSHFAEQASRDRAAPVQVRSGWLGRYLSLSPNANPTFRAFSHANAIIPSMYSEKPTLSMNGFDDYYLAGDSVGARRLINSVYNSAGGELAAMAASTLNSVNEVKQMKDSGYTPANGASYVGDSMGPRLKEVAQIIKSNRGLEVVSIDSDGWDSHTRQVDELNPVIRDLSTNLAAFRKDLGPELMKRVIVITQSEFGRTTVENASGGTDHGMGSFIMVMSGKVKPKVTVGAFPGLKPTAGEKDMPIVTDYRDIIAEVVAKGMNSSNISQIFPGYSPTYRGILR